MDPCTFYELDQSYVNFNTPHLITIFLPSLPPNQTMSSFLATSTLMYSGLNSTISSFFDKNEFIYSGNICKEWTHHETKNTSTNSLVSSESRLKEAIDSGFVPTGKTLTRAIEVGNLECIKQLWSKIRKFQDYDFAYAAINGNLDNMKWLLTNGCPFSSLTFNGAAVNGNLDNMKWLLANKCPFGDDAFLCAAENGNLDNMKWLFDKGCPFGEYTFDFAANHGNLDNLKWLFDKGCPVSNMKFTSAAGYENIEKMMLVRMPGYGCPDTYTPEFY